VAGVDSFPLLAVPFFILAGELMNAGGISKRIIDMAQAWVGHIRGGLGYVAIGAAVLMASMSGSALADTAALATILLPMMRARATRCHLGRPDRLGRHHRADHPAVDALRDLRRHHQHLDLGAVPLGHRAGPDHGRRADRRVEAGAAQDRPAQGEPLPMKRAPARHGQGLLGHADAADHHRRHEDRRVHADRSGRGGGLLCAGGRLFVHREMKLAEIGPVLVRAAKTTAIVMFLCAGAQVASYMITLADLPELLTGWLGPLVESPRLLMAVMMVVLVLIGTALDLTPTILIFAPVMLPIAVKAGIDPVYFGLMFVLNGAIGLITPPVGTVLNVVAGVGRLSMHQVIKGVNPFLITYILILALFVLFPQLVTAPVAWMR
jgi:TRAP-type mannitol/chloroaromatic compound transport system permease large subunit